ncbi:DUF2218 domain-containing protein [Actinoplanes sp. NPDC026619]|uniref:DUF2218 domain-containing protein n=1 Tax=Actinoplanes sp. NPDC026619 TaxID=3155798 RepID=UPI0033F67D3E
MPTSYARIPTDRAGRYLVQFCRHAAAIGSGGHTPRMHLAASPARRPVEVTADWTDTAGTVVFTGWGQCTLTADNKALALRIDAVDDDGLAQIRDVIDRDLERFSRRDPLPVVWQGADPAASPQRQRGFLRRHRQTGLLSLAVVLAAALHLGLAGALVRHSWWSSVAFDAVIALALIKIALLRWARQPARRRRTGTETPGPH